MWAWALAFSLALCLPRLGASGFWDPSELKLAEQARDIARSDSLLDPTVAGKYAARPPLDLSMAALGIRIFGASEIGARALLRAVGHRRADGDLLGGRRPAAQAGRPAGGAGAGDDAALRAGGAPADLGRAAHRGAGAGAGRARPLRLAGRRAPARPDLVLGLVGLAVGLLAGGAMSGVVLPLLALTLALAVGRGLRALPTAAVDDGTAPLAEPGVGPDVAAERTLGASTWRLGRARLRPAGAARRARRRWCWPAASFHVVAGKYSWLVGGVPRSGAPAHTFEALVRELGFGLFPWSAVAVFALARPLIRLDADAAKASRARTRASPSSSSTCCSSPAWATRSRATATSCSARRGTRPSPPSRWRSAPSSTRRWRGCAPSRWPAS